MSLSITFVLLFGITTYSLIHLGSYDQPGQAVLYENGTCTNEALNNSSNSLINTNGTVGDFLKSLPSDNTIFAEIMCNNSAIEAEISSPEVAVSNALSSFDIVE
ncbi:MAG TPA: hypothetical protein VJ772_11625 [Nitrososphaeraceae archaeon]|nr:hypothetical protein [Nitrososphaeraceae archaeon]